MKKQIIIPFLILMAFVINCNSQQESAGTDYQNLTDLQWIEKAVDIIVEDNDVPAVTLALIKDGRVEHFITRGVLHRETNIRADKNTLFQIGSLSKTFTGIIANNLIREGKLDVSSSITDYLPKTLSPATLKKLEPIKVEDVLFHRSGLPRDSKIVKRFGNDPMVCCYTEKDLLDDLELLEIQFKPDEKSQYSNLGFGLLGYIFERATAKSFEELLQTYVARPYHLSNTTTKPDKTQLNKLATPYRKENRGIETKPFEMGKLVAAGGIYSTVAELAKLMTLQMTARRNFVKETETTPLVLTKNIKPFWKHLSYGYGQFVTNEGGYGHGGDVDGFASGYTFFPKENLGLVYLTSSGGNWVGSFENIIVKKLRGKPVQMPGFTETISVPEEKLLKYTGTFKFEGNNILNIVQKGNNLEAYPQGDFGPYKLSFKTENKLFSKTYGHQIEYEFDENKRVSGISFIFGDQKLSGKKID